MILELMLDGQLTWNIALLACFLAVCLLYIILLKAPINRLQFFVFFTGICLLYIMIGSPLTALSKLSFSLHMLQMSIIYFLIPPLLLFGIPYQMFRTVLLKTTLKIRPITHMVSTISLYAFAILLLLYHIPLIFIFLLQHPLLQNSYEILLFILSLSMWWPIASPNPNQRLCKSQLKRYVFKSTMLITPACLYFICTAFIDEVNNPFLSEFIAHLCLPDVDSITILPPPFNTKVDQFMAGICMFGLHKAGLMLALKLAASGSNYK